MKTAISAVACALALALAACDFPEDRPKTAPAAAPETGQVTLDSTAALQDWLMLARTSDGGYVHFNQRSIYRTSEGIASIQVQVRYGQPQLFAMEDARSETTVRYTVERIDFYFNCADGTFATGERQIVDADDVVQATVPGQADVFRPIEARGIAALIQPTACRGT